MVEEISWYRNGVCVMSIILSKLFRRPRPTHDGDPKFIYFSPLLYLPLNIVMMLEERLHTCSNADRKIWKL